ncbi:MAG: peptidylprolyl isomerase [Parachlamydiaceae bacterium]
MTMKLISFLHALPFLLMPFHSHAEVSLLANKPTEHVVVNNRVLAKVNGKAISVMDVMKKMDILFYREFPQYTSFPEARFQFYEANWKYVLQELIDKELIIADAEENKLPVSSGDVRQEMERMFGPNIISNLDSIGMTFEEAWKIVQGDILLQRMLFVRVNAKALREVTPKDVQTYYEEYAKENVTLPQWNYQVITIRDKNPEKGEETAKLAYKLLTEEKVGLPELATRIKSTPQAPVSQVSVSEMYSHSDKEISPSYKEILSKMTPGTYSEPVAQKSKDKSMVYRLFFLDRMTPGGVPPFKDVEGKLKEKLLEKEITEKSQAYIKRLRSHFDVQEMIPEGFEPFELK